jgi:hypothetical protein
MRSKSPDNQGVQAPWDRTIGGKIFERKEYQNSGAYNALLSDGRVLIKALSRDGALLDTSLVKASKTSEPRPALSNRITLVDRITVLALPTTLRPPF